MQQAKNLKAGYGWISPGLIQRRLRVPMLLSFYLCEMIGGRTYPQGWLPKTPPTH